MNHREPGSSIWSLLGASVLATACGAPPTDDAYFEPSDEQLAKADIPSFEEYESWAKRSGDSYVIEFDLPIRDEAELRAHYEERFLAERSKSAVRLTSTDGSGTGCVALSETCVDDKFYSGQQRDLRYCIDDDFGVFKPNMIAAMAAANTQWKAPGAWANASQVKLTYVPTQDANCGVSDPLPAGVYFKVSRWDQPKACAFWPLSGRTCAGLDGRTIGYGPGGFTLSDMEEVMVHEVGHVLGMHHEHMRLDAPNGSSCPAAAEMRYLTTVDTLSIMAYPLAFDPCGFSGAGAAVTTQDAAGIRRLYGIPVPWHLPTTLDISISG
jgi:hypothetical protein